MQKTDYFNIFLLPPPVENEMLTGFIAKNFGIDFSVFFTQMRLICQRLAIF